MSEPPHSHFDTSALPREHQFAAWRNAVNAHAQLKKTLSQVWVGVPIQYAKPVAH